MKALRIGQQRNEQLRKSAWQTSTYGQKFMEREKQLFGYYGMGTLEKMDGYLVEFFPPNEQDPFWYHEVVISHVQVFLYIRY